MRAVHCAPWCSGGYACLRYADEMQAHEKSAYDVSIMWGIGCYVTSTEYTVPAPCQSTDPDNVTCPDCRKNIMEIPE